MVILSAGRELQNWKIASEMTIDSALAVFSMYVLFSNRIERKGSFLGVPWDLLRIPKSYGQNASDEEQKKQRKEAGNHRESV